MFYTNRKVSRYADPLTMLSYNLPAEASPGGIQAMGVDTLTVPASSGTTGLTELWPSMTVWDDLEDRYLV